MKRFLCSAVLLAVTGCANESGATMGLFSADAPVIAMLKDDLFVGQTTGYADRTGTINVHSVVNPEIKCIGNFQYTASNSGQAHLQCNDGAEADLTFNSLTLLSGYGYGRSSRGPASFTYGLTPEQANQYLQFPPHKKLIKGPTGPRLEPI